MATSTEAVFDVSVKQKTGTPYDDVFRTLLVDCPELVIPLINEAFEAHYVRNEKVTVHHNECQSTHWKKSWKRNCIF